MIKINLLPHLKAKKAKQQTLLQYQIWVLAGLLVVLTLVLGYFWLHLENRVEVLRQQKVARVQELEALKKKVREVENFERDKKAFEEKIKIIRQLKLNQSGPVQLLDQVSRSLPQRVWLTEISQRGNEVHITGKAMGNPDLVGFIKRLRRSRVFSSVDLLESRQANEAGVPIYNFRLSGTLSL